MVDDRLPQESRRKGDVLHSSPRPPRSDPYPLLRGTQDNRGSLRPHPVRTSRPHRWVLSLVIYVCVRRYTSPVGHRTGPGVQAETPLTSGVTPRVVPLSGQGPEIYDTETERPIAENDPFCHSRG